MRGEDSVSSGDEGTEDKGRADDGADSEENTPGEARVRPLSAGLKVLAVLEAVATRQPIGVTGISKQIGLPKSTVQRILEDLAGGGWVTPARESQRQWAATRRVLALGLAAAESDDLMDFAPQELAAVRDETGETVHLVLRDADELFVAAHMDSPQPVRTHVEIGARSPMHATSSGIAFLAALPDEAVDEILSRGMPRYTDSTPVTREQVWSEVRRVRETGFAVNPEGWWRPDVFAVAAVVSDAQGQPVAAVTISAPASRFTDTAAADLGVRVRTLASHLTERLQLNTAHRG